MRLPRIAAVLLVVTAALFVLGTRAEPSSGHAESTEHTETGGHDESAEAGGHDESTEAGGNDESTENRDVFGVDPEGVGPVTAAVVMSLAVAAGLWLTRRRLVAVAVVVFAVGFAVLDALEVAHQLDEDRLAIAVLAAVIALGHLAAGALAGASLRPATAEESP